MTNEEIEYRIVELKQDYVRIQSDLEKLQSVGGYASPTEKVLENLEEELRDLRKQLEAR